MFTVIKKIINFPNKFERKIFGYNIESPNLEYSTNVAKVFLSGWVLPREEKEAQIVVEGSGVMETFPCDVQRDDVTKTILGEINPNIKCGFQIKWIHTGIFNISFVVEGEKMLIAEIEITSCREIEIVEDSNQASVYFQLGKDQEQEGNIEEAIASYLEAVKLSLGNFSYCQGLSEALIKINQPHHWEQAITIYRRIISENPNSIGVNYFLGFYLQNTQQFEAACQAYQNTISINPDFFWAYFSLVNCAKEMQQWEEAIIAYQRALELNPGCTSLNSDIAEAYYQLGKKYKEMQQWEEAIIAYQRALELNPGCTSLNSDIAEAYYQLGKKYIEQNQLEEAAQCYQKVLEKQPHQKLAYYDLQEAITRAYHQLGIHQAEQGLLDEALICFKFAERGVTDLPIYEQIWIGLNGLATIDEACPYYQKEIQLDAAKAYFQQSSQYRLIDITSLNQHDREFIEKAGLSLENLKLMPLEDIALEELYINSFGYEQKVELDRLGLWGRTYQKSLVETGYIYSLCPWTGKIIRSNKSVGFYHTCGDHPVIIYLFVGQQTFYVIYGSWIAEKTIIYLPSLELIIKVAHSLFGEVLASYIERINVLKAEMVTSWKSVKSYINSDQPKQVALMTAWNKNLGHYMWNELEAIQNLEHQGMLKKIDKFLVGQYDYFNPCQLFDIPETKVIDTSGYSYLDLLNLVTANNYVVVSLRYTHLVTEELAQRISQLSVKRSSLDVLEEVESAKKHFPLLCIQFRSHYRVWLSQIEGTANIIKELYADFPNLAVVFDGWSLPERPDKRALSGIATDQALVEQIITLLPSDIPVYSAIGQTTYETVVWANAVDSYIATMGSGLTYLVWIANKRGVIHSNTFMMNQHTVDVTSSFRENCATNIFIPNSEIQDQGQPASVTNYDVDWKFILQQIKNILDTLPSRTYDDKQNLFLDE
jgi:tetratricopeptide (TPR) repeat protein